jgi:hypothetical protein
VFPHRNKLAKIPLKPRSSKDHAKKFFKAPIDPKYAQTAGDKIIRSAYLSDAYNCFLASTVTAFKIRIESSYLQNNHRFVKFLPAKIGTRQQISNTTTAFSSQRERKPFSMSLLLTSPLWIAFFRVTLSGVAVTSADAFCSHGQAVAASYWKQEFCQLSAHSFFVSN